MKKANQVNQIVQPLRVQQMGGSFQVEIISDPSVKQNLFGWLSAHEIGPESTFRFSAQLDSRKMGVIRNAPMMTAKRPGFARSGYLCFYPPLKVAIFVEDSDHRKDQEVVRPPKTTIMRMRHSPAIYNSGGSVFAATLNVSDSTLWIEDVLVWEGQPIWKTQPFSRRWTQLKSWFENDWTEDPNLQRGLIVKPRNPQPLESFQSEPGDVWEFIPEDAGKRRLLWKDKRLSKMVISSYPQKEMPKNTKYHGQKHDNKGKEVTIATAVVTPLVQVGILDTYFPTLPSPEEQNDNVKIAIAKKALSGPDVYTLHTADSHELGIAVIRKMALSLAMRTHCTEATRVRVEWNSSFERWEIVDVNVSRKASFKNAFDNKNND